MDLLVVVLIIGILAAIALPQYRVAVAKSRYVQLMTAGDAMARAEEMFYMANGRYTADSEELDVSMPEGKFALDLAVHEDRGHAAVTVTNRDLGLEHVVYFEHHVGYQAGSRFCRVRGASSDSYLHNLCKSLTNTTTPSATAEGIYVEYKFQ